LGLIFGLVLLVVAAVVITGVGVGFVVGLLPRPARIITVIAIFAVAIFGLSTLSYVGLADELAIKSIVVGSPIVGLVTLMFMGPTRKRFYRAIERFRTSTSPRTKMAIVVSLVGLLALAAASFGLNKAEESAMWERLAGEWFGFATTYGDSASYRVNIRPDGTVLVRVIGNASQGRTVPIKEVRELGPNYLRLIKEYEPGDPGGVMYILSRNQEHRAAWPQPDVTDSRLLRLDDTSDTASRFAAMIRATPDPSAYPVDALESISNGTEVSLYQFSDSPDLYAAFVFGRIAFSGDPEGYYPCRYLHGLAFHLSGDNWTEIDRGSWHPPGLVCDVDEKAPYGHDVMPAPFNNPPSGIMGSFEHAVSEFVQRVSPDGSNEK
jgi:hypothetical protein